MIMYAKHVNIFGRIKASKQLKRRIFQANQYMIVLRNDVQTNVMNFEFGILSRGYIHQCYHQSFFL